MRFWRARTDRNVRPLAESRRSSVPSVRSSIIQHLHRCGENAVIPRMQISIFDKLTGRSSDRQAKVPPRLPTTRPPVTDADVGKYRLGGGLCVRSFP